MSESHVSAAALHRWSSSLQNDGETIGTRINAALTAIGAEAGCWGADDAGNSFATAYLPAATSLLAAAVTAGDQIADLSERLEISARGYQRTEATNSTVAKG